jgi:two-component sensor histidine kinase
MDIKKYTGILDAISKTTLQSILIVDRNCQIKYFNQKSKNIIGRLYNKKPKLNDKIFDCLSNEAKSLFEKNIKKAFVGRTVTTEIHIQSIENYRDTITVHFSPVSQDGTHYYVCISLMDFTNHENSGILTYTPGEYLSDSLHPGRLASFEMEYPYGAVSWSKETAEIIGIDLYNSPVNIYEFLHFVHPSDKNKLISKIEDSISKKEKFQIVFRFMKDENFKYLQMNGSITQHMKTGKIYLFGTIMDVTESKKAEEKVRNILIENEELLKEIQHRVKNNFQVMLSLLSLQSRRIKDKEFHDVFKVTQNRIKTLALVYEKLYYSKELSKINFGEYVNNLIKNLVYVYAINPLKITIKINAENVPMDLNKAVPCGLIINELVSNSMRYAFSETGKGEISVCLREKENNIELIVADNGTGIPDSIDYKSTETLGLQLVMTLVAQIDGLINYDGSSGSKFIITFPLKNNNTPENLEAEI